jgi:hypothetical protein
MTHRDDDDGPWFPGRGAYNWVIGLVVWTGLFLFIGLGSGAGLFWGARDAMRYGTTASFASKVEDWGLGFAIGAGLLMLGQIGIWVAAYRWRREVRDWLERERDSRAFMRWPQNPT